MLLRLLFDSLRYKLFIMCRNIFFPVTYKYFIRQYRSFHKSILSYAVGIGIITNNKY